MVCPSCTAGVFPKNKSAPAPVRPGWFRQMLVRFRKNSMRPKAAPHTPEEDLRQDDKK